MDRSSIRPQTLIVFIVALALVGFTIFLLSSEQGKLIVSTPTPTEEETALFPPEDGIAITINIEDRAGKEVEMKRDPATGNWAFTKPRAGSASLGAVDAAAGQIVYMSILTRLDADADPAVYGLKTPAYIITLEFQNGPAKSLRIGDSTPTGSGYYIRLDDGSIVVIGKGGIDSLLALFTSPPYAETETPTPLPATTTPTVTPTLLETATPEGTLENAPQESPTGTTAAETIPSEPATATSTP